MTNFLARIAAPVLHSQSTAPQRLQPMLGSVYVPDTSFTAVESSVMSAPPPSATSTDTLLSPMSAPVMPRSEPGRAEASHDILTKLQPRTLQPNATSSQASDQVRLYGEEALLPTETAAAHASAGNEISTSKKLTKEAFQPLTSTAEQPLLPHVPQAVRVAPLRPAQPVQTHRPAPNSEPDEIHIHIGRIEVAAVPQPAARPTAAPPRRSLNLEEYLHRGSGGRG